MTIAICLSGVPRTFVHTAPTLQRYFAGHDVDLFLHLWQKETDASLLEQLKSTYRPVNICLADRPNTDVGKSILAHRFSEKPNPFSFDMFYAIEQGVQSVPQGKYSHIVRARYDTIFDGVCPDEIFAIQSTAIIVPDNYTPPKGCNDQFAVGSEESIRSYAGMYRWLTKNVGNRQVLTDDLFASNPSEFRPEQALMTFLSVGHQVVQAPLALTLLRDADIGKPFQELPMDNNQGTNISYEAWKKHRDDQALGLPSRNSPAHCALYTTKKM